MNEWTEQNSQSFIDYGRYFVPQREYQMGLISDLIPARTEPFTVLELACGEGLLAETILERHRPSRVLGLDISPTMRAAAEKRLARFGDRFRTAPFELAAADWRQTPERRLAADPVHAIVSSLTIHHLDDQGKQQLYADLRPLLAPGGALIIADLIQPLTPEATEAAAAAWDAAVRERSLLLDGNTAVFDRFQQTEWNLFRHPDSMDTPSPIYDNLKWLELAGYTAVAVYWMAAGHAIYGGRQPS